MKRVLALLLFLAIAGSSRPAQAQFLTSGNITAAGSGCTTGTGPTTSCIIVALRQDVASVAFTVSGTFSATLQFKVSQDGVNFTSVNSFPPNSTTPVTSTTAVGTWTAGVAGMAAFEIYASAYTSGTATVSISGSRGLSASLLGSGGGGGALPSGVKGQTVINNGSGATSYSALSPSLPIGNGGAAVSLASANYTILCDSATVATGVQDRGTVIVVGTSGANDVVIPDLAGTGCGGMYGMVENSTSSSITVSRQTSDTLNIYGPSQGAPSTGQTTFTLAAGQWATYSPSVTTTAYDVRISAPSASGGVTNSTITVVNATFGANGCYSNAATPVLNTASTLTMSGVATSMVISIAPGADLHTVTGFGSTGGLVVLAWPSAANTVSYYVCNQTASSITTGATALMNVGAR